MKVQNLSLKNKYDLYTNEELIKQFQNGNKDIKDYFFERNRPLILNLIKKFKRKDLEEDIYQIACLGFVKAFNQFDISYNVKFSTYAVPIILGEIKKFFRDQGSIHVTRSLKENYIKIMDAKAHLQQVYLKDPTLEQLANYTNITMEDLVLSLNANQFVSSVDDVLYEQEGNGITLLDVSKDQKQIDIVLNVALKNEEKNLDEIERKILYYRYIEHLKQHEIATLLQMNQVQVSRLEKKILLKLREKFSM